MEIEQKIVLDDVLFLFFFYLKEAALWSFRVPRDVKTGSSDPPTSLCSVFNVLSALGGRHD